jgi:hypothetical protein
MIEQINKNDSLKNDLLAEKGYGYLPFKLASGLNSNDGIGCKY